MTDLVRPVTSVQDIIDITQDAIGVIQGDPPFYTDDEESRTRLVTAELESILEFFNVKFETLV